MGYKFNEDKLLKEIKEYIDSTYKGHYKGKIQSIEATIDSGHGTGFCIGSIQKYSKRYGKKNGYNRKDIIKIIHYALFQLFIHDKENLGSTPELLNESTLWKLK